MLSLHRYSMFSFLAVLTLALAPLWVTAGDPEVTITRVENLPNRLFYFEDTPVSYHLDYIAEPSLKSR